MSDSKAGGASIRRPAAPSGRPAITPYDKDVILWSQEQARPLCAMRFAELDIEHLADEIEDVGKSEKRELASRVAVLLAHLLKWSGQPENRSKSWRATIVLQRKRIALALKATPSLKAVMRDPIWREDMWARRACSGQRRNGSGAGGLARDLPLDDGPGGRTGFLARVTEEVTRGSNFLCWLPRLSGILIQCYSGQNRSSMTCVKLHGQRAGNSSSSNSVSIAAFKRADR